MIVANDRFTNERLRALGLSKGFVIVPNVNHGRIVLELSRSDHVAGPAILKFLRETQCPRAGSGHENGVEFR